MHALEPADDRLERGAARRFSKQVDFVYDEQAGGTQQQREVVAATCQRIELFWRAQDHICRLHFSQRRGGSEAVCTELAYAYAEAAEPRLPVAHPLRKQSLQRGDVHSLLVAAE